MRSSLVWAFTALAAVSSAATVSSTGRCGASFGLTCKGSSYGSCCSEYNFCGSTSDHCGSGCKTGYGTCNSAAGAPAPSPSVSQDGSCGGANGYTCLNSPWGNCCSQHGYCGKSSAYCGVGCNPKLGTCLNSPSSPSTATSRPTTLSTRTSSAAASATLRVSTNARCGYAQNASPGGMTCVGSQWGDCCSDQGYCGRSDAYCKAGCQAGFGICGSTQVSTSSSTTSTSTTSSTSSSSLTETSTSSSISSTSSSTTSTTSSISPSSSTLTTSETTSTSATSAPTPPVSCGVRGTMQGFGIGGADSNDYDSCRRNCLNYPECQSFTVGDVPVPPGQDPKIGEGCMMYYASVATGLTVDPSSRGTFYDRNCPAAGSTSMISSTGPATSSTSSSLTSSSSTPSPTFVCGREGIPVNAGSDAGVILHDTTESGASSLVECKTRCQYTALCTYFVWEPNTSNPEGSGTCDLHGGPIGESFYDGDWGWEYERYSTWERGCMPDVVIPTPAVPYTCGGLGVTSVDLATHIGTIRTVYYMAACQYICWNGDNPGCNYIVFDGSKDPNQEGNCYLFGSTVLADGGFQSRTDGTLYTWENECRVNKPYSSIINPPPTSQRG